jgi:hypothetical protein
VRPFFDCLKGDIELPVIEGPVEGICFKNLLFRGGSKSSSYRVMSWQELRALFADTVGDALRPHALAEVVDLVAAHDQDSRPRDITRAFVAAPGWLDESNNRVKPAHRPTGQSTHS